jgi:hypothetical protein
MTAWRLVARSFALAGVAGVGLFLAPQPATATPAPFTFNEAAQCVPPYITTTPPGDAGNSVNVACQMSGGPYGVISGNIGDLVDFDDYFAFKWLQNGNFRATYTAGAFVGDVALQLFADSSPSFPLVGGQVFDPVTDSLTALNLLAGNYILHVEALIDPPYTVQIFELNPNLTVNTAIPNPICGVVDNPNCGAVPEPSTMVLLGTGFAVLALRIRARKSTA